MLPLRKQYLWQNILYYYNWHNISYTSKTLIGLKKIRALTVTCDTNSAVGFKVVSFNLNDSVDKS